MANSIHIDLYNNYAEKNRVNKTAYIHKVDSVVGTFRGEVNVTSLSIILDGLNDKTFNYVYIAEFSRYYFVENITYLSSKRMRVTLLVDVLYTYREYLYTLEAYIDRNEAEYNGDLVDKKLPVMSGYDIRTDIGLDNELFTLNGGSYILNGLFLGTRSKT